MKSGHVWLSVALSHCCLLMMWHMTEVWILNWATRLLLRISIFLQDWQDGADGNVRNDPKHAWKTNPEVFRGKVADCQSKAAEEKSCRKVWNQRVIKRAVVSGRRFLQKILDKLLNRNILFLIMWICTMTSCLVVHWFQPLEIKLRVCTCSMIVSFELYLCHCLKNQLYFLYIL